MRVGDKGKKLANESTAVNKRMPIQNQHHTNQSAQEIMKFHFCINYKLEAITNALDRRSYSSLQGQVLGHFWYVH